MTANPLIRVPHRRGFALIVTISLMILLTIVAVGLLTLSSISLRSSTTNSAMADARANARLALLLAVGQLQKHAGQDQRTTTTANIAGSGTGEALAGGQAPANNSTITSQTKGLSPVQAGTRYWTGVFSNRDTPVSIYTKTPSPNLVQWLVSGSDTETTPITPTDGRCSVVAGGKVSDPTKAVILAGENSVGSDTAGIERHVAVPLLNVLDRTGTRPAGRYGWWVGDEGVKASLNIAEKSTDPSLQASLVAERRGWETIAGLANYPRPGSADNLALEKISSLPQAELLVSAFGAETGGLSPLQSIFHSATATSRGLLTDTLNGGTRVDLTAILFGALPTTSAVPSMLNYPARSQTIIPRSVVPRMKAPLWDNLKDFNDRHAAMKNGTLIVKPATSDLSAAIAPLITDFRLLLGARLKGRGGRTPDLFSLNSCGKIAIAIANPYGVPLRWERDLEFEVISMTPEGNRPSCIWNLGGNRHRSAYFPQHPYTEAAVFTKALFRIQASTLNAGEARAYTMASYVYRTAATGAQQVVIDLKPFQSSAPFNFSNCIELENTEPITIATGGSTPSMDVRESWQTTLVGLEMRLSGSSGNLRRLERFELDNGYFSPNARSFTRDVANRMTQPFPMMLYSFQISQPGGEYQPLMPGGYEIGMRASTIRTFADFNLQATRFRKPIASYNPPPFFVESNNSRSQLPADEPGGQTGTGFTRNLAADPLPWGRSPFASRSTVLFSVPNQISSIAMLQHADLTGDDFHASIAHQPGNAVGNSWSTPFVKRSLTLQPRTDYELYGSPNQSGAKQTASTYYDLTYLLNSALWDSYYFSTIPRSGSGMPEVTTYDVLGDSSASELKDPVKAATRLMVKGSFNINSTDKNAWKAFLASARHTKHQSDSGENADAAFPRSLDRPDTSAVPPTGTAVDSFSGFRRLSDAQLDLLAEEIVKQVRLRGPFVSLSHFINRSIGDINRHAAVTRSGPLQAAIDESGLNINHSGNRNVFTGINAAIDAVTLRSFEGAPRADFDGGDRQGRPASADSSTPDWATTSTDNNFGSVASIVADRETIIEDRMRREQGYRSTGIPGWLTQADVLQVIGPALSARSDTFRIRTFGESLDANGKTVATAYCEAIIQRMPDYVDPSNPPNARGNELSATNRTYGRKFEIVSFRWLTPAEI